MIKEVNGFEAMKKLKRTFIDFIMDEELITLTVLGNPRYGKRYWLKKALEELGIKDYIWLSGIAGKSLEEYYYKQLCEKPDKVIVFYELTATGFSNAKEKSFFINLTQNRTVSNPGDPEKNGLPAQLQFTGKAVIMDDPYAKRSKQISESLNGFSFRMSIIDLIEYLEYSIDSLVEEHKVSKKSLDTILSMLKIVYSKKSNPVTFFPHSNIHNIVLTAKQLDEHPDNEKKILERFTYHILQS